VRDQNKDYRLLPVYTGPYMCYIFIVLVGKMAKKSS